jgi:hypothetical protein
MEELQMDGFSYVKPLKIHAGWLFPRKLRRYLAILYNFNGAIILLALILVKIEALTI